MNSIKKILAVMLSVLLALGVMSVSVFAEDVAGDTTEGTTDSTTGDVTDGTTGDVEDAEVISVVDVLVATPADGDEVTGIYSIDGFEYHLTFIQWIEYETQNILYSSDKNVDAEGYFEAGKSYVVCLTVNANSGYVFDAQENLTITVNGEEAVFADISEDGTELSFTCILDCEYPEGDGQGDAPESGFDFSVIFGYIKSVFKTFLRLIGAFFGIS